MTITTTGRHQYRATFNKRSLTIDATGTLPATDTATGATLHGDELRSVRRLVEWHVKSGRDCDCDTFQCWPQCPTEWTQAKQLSLLQSAEKRVVE